MCVCIYLYTYVICISIYLSIYIISPSLSDLLNFQMPDDIYTLYLLDCQVRDTVTTSTSPPHGLYPGFSCQKLWFFENTTVFSNNMFFSKNRRKLNKCSKSDTVIIWRTQWKTTNLGPSKNHPVRWIVCIGLYIPLPRNTLPNTTKSNNGC